MDVLKKLHKIWGFAPRPLPITVLLFLLIAYCEFHLIREKIPNEFLKGSFPSMLVMPLVLFIINLFTSIRFQTHHHKIIITFLASGMMSLWLEWLVPLFYSRSTGDINDVLAIFIGWSIYCVVDQCPSSNGLRHMD
jgi:hypothetical protein